MQFFKECSTGAGGQCWQIGWRDCKKDAGTIEPDGYALQIIYGMGGEFIFLVMAFSSDTAN